MSPQLDFWGPCFDPISTCCSYINSQEWSHWNKSFGAPLEGFRISCHVAEEGPRRSEFWPAPYAMWRWTSGPAVETQLGRSGAGRWSIRLSRFAILVELCFGSRNQRTPPDASCDNLDATTRSTSESQRMSPEPRLHPAQARSSRPQPPAEVVIIGYVVTYDDPQISRGKHTVRGFAASPPSPRGPADLRPGRLPQYT